ncbi:alpha/beta hydrolase [Thalassovita taeanensis]|uniref:Acetyl esterase/lipase n=1 Tax=Thalassovita taeanensis TaxID=657014 RepID=A0A1H9H9V8_9RHOB|nr:alpha/beta hydrolase [Thalassovita taeanensis]SEQ59169.1 Acetyl esterase/lipase [Thalassovita taeanensis]
MTDAKLMSNVLQRLAKTFDSWGATTTLAQMRADFDTLLQSDVVATAHPVNAAGIDAAWLFPAQDSDNVVLYFHGGGYQLGSISSHLDLMSRLSLTSQARVLGFNYRLAPEHKFPSAVEDSVLVYRWLLDQGIEPNRIAFAGDSAGAGLAVATLLQSRTEGLPMPACAVLLSPWLDMEAKGETFVSRAAVDPLTQRDKLLLMARTYLGRGGNPLDPLASPIHGDLTGLPPMLIHVGDHETILDDSRAFLPLAKKAGIEVELVIWPEMIHHFQVFPELPEARQSVEQIGSYLNQQFARGVNGRV